MVTPIYLVSACSTGEEFVAAFRRYADRSGLFVPMAEPIAVGKRGRFAVTLTGGAVMIEGDGEVISSARTPSVLHGRIGMTVRFANLDGDSKTVLLELEKARLVTKPPAPTVTPRMAEVPPAPRATLPALGGRIDASNARAECVAIGDVEALTSIERAPARTTGPKFVVPAIPPRTSTSQQFPAVGAKPTIEMQPPPPAPPPAPPGTLPPPFKPMGKAGAYSQTIPAVRVEDLVAPNAPRTTTSPMPEPPAVPRSATRSSPPPVPVVAAAPEVSVIAEVSVIEIVDEKTALSEGPPEAEPAMSRTRTSLGVAPSAPATTKMAPVGDDAVPSGDWTITLSHGDSQPTVVPIQHPALPPAGPPTGDWTISLDASSPTGWSEPVKLAVKPPPVPRSDEPKVEVDASLRSESVAVIHSPAPVASASGSQPLFAPAPGTYPTVKAPVTADRVVTDGGTGFFRESGELPELSDSRAGGAAPRSRVWIVVAVVVALAAAGIAVVVLGARGSAPVTSEAPVPAPPPPPVPPPVPVPAPVPAPVPPPVTATPAVQAPEPAAPTCYAVLASSPSGADVVRGSEVIGKTPARLPLPCGAPTRLTFRKARYVAVARNVTPSTVDARVQVALVKQTVAVKVSTVPNGATVTWGGRAHGMTPTTLHLPVLEATAVTFTHKDFAPETIRVVPKPGQPAITTPLKKRGRR